MEVRYTVKLAVAVLVTTNPCR